MMRFLLKWVVTTLVLFTIQACSQKPEKPDSGSGKNTAGPVISAADIADNNRGVALMGSFKYQDAQDVFAAVVRRQPQWLTAKINWAIATLNLQTQGSETRALEILVEVLAADPENPRALYCTGLLNLFLGNSERALTHFRMVAERDGDDAYAAYYVAQCLTRQGNMEEALAWYERAIENNGYLRSAYYGLFQTYQRLGKRDQARDMLAAFQKLEQNPRALQVEFKYTRMGPKAETLTEDLPNQPPPPLPQGPVFAAIAPLLSLAGDLSWRQPTADEPANISFCDINGDGWLDLFYPAGLIAGGEVRNGVFVARGATGPYTAVPDHPLATVTDVHAAAWGDMDNDGLVDVYLLRRGANQLWRQNPAGQWRDLTRSSATAGGTADTVDGAWLDADHDGDLDLFLVNGDGPNELLSNNLDGTFRPLAASQGIAGRGAGSFHFLAADLDHDRDVDLVILNREPPHEVYLNDRLWQYRTATGFESFSGRSLSGAIAADLDADGRTELYSRDDQGLLERWAADADGTWRPTTLVENTEPGSLILADLFGTGALGLLYTSEGRTEFWTPMAQDPFEVGVATGAALANRWFPAYFQPERGVALVAVAANGSLNLAAPGPGRHAFAGFQFTGKDSKADSMRSNALGLGTTFAVRTGSRWSALSNFRNDSIAGQSYQPLAIGLGGKDEMDFVAITWSDGVFQTELGLESGRTHLIVETQRQLSSCPVLFAWNGQEFEFVSDLLGVGGIGYALAPGEYGTPRPWEHFLLPEGLPVATKDGLFALKIAEPMEEACYLDAARLVIYDLPPGWSMTLDERMGLSEPQPTGAPVFYRREQLPIRAVNERGMDITLMLSHADREAAPLPELDHRFIGRLQSEHVLTLEFERPLDEGDGEPVLVIDGWVEYPYSQTNFAAWQAGASFDPPTLEARAGQGQWKVVLAGFGYPAGMPRQMSVPIANLPSGGNQLRLRTNMEIYWDRVAVVFAEACPDAVRTPLKLVGAELNAEGFARRETGPQRLPSYNDNQRAPLWDTRHQAGFYTDLGPMTELVSARDDALAIFGPGEAVSLQFSPPEHEPAKGLQRRFVLETAGWCKDMDLYTKDGETLAPLPGSGKPSASKDALHQKYNGRYQSGY